MATQSVGQGANGKSLLESLITLAFGNYCKTMDVAYLTKTNHQVSANAPDEILACLAKCLIVFINEVGKRTVLKENKLKMLSGGDVVSCRACNQHLFEFKPKFTLFMLTNYDLTIDGTDEALKRRPQKIPFRNQFVEKPTQPNHRKIDRSLKEKFNENNYKLALIEILFKHFDMFRTDQNGNIIAELDPPKSIKDLTQQFLDENNPVKDFVTEKLTVTNNEKDTIPASDLYKQYIEFNDGDSKNITATDFKCELEKNGIKSKKTKTCNVFCKIQLKQIKMFDDTQEIEFLEEDEDLVIVEPLDDMLSKKKQIL